MSAGTGTIFRSGLTWSLEAPDVMRVLDDGGEILCFWNEAEGYVRYHEDGTQEEFAPDTVLGEYTLPPTVEAESVIEELRARDGVVY